MMKRALVAGCLLAAASLCAQTSDPSGSKATFSAREDTWFDSNAPADRGGSAELRAGSAGAREAVVKFEVRNVLGAVSGVRLRLFVSGTAAGNTTVYAAHNNWTETAADRSAAPATKTALVTVPNPSAGSVGGYVDFDISNLVSSPEPANYVAQASSVPASGVYSFVIRTDSASGDLVFQSSEGANPPQLNVWRGTSADQNPLYIRHPKTAIDMGEIYKKQYNNSTPTTLDPDITNIGIFDVTKQPYGADPTGTIDSTLAIQRALAESRDARMVCYIPSGTYLISDQLHAVAGIIEYEHVNGERLNQREFPTMIAGPEKGARPILKLKPITPAEIAKFTSAAKPTPLLYVWCRKNENNGTINELATHFNQTVCNLDLDISGGYPTASGLSQMSAQGGSFYNISVNATGAHSGFIGGAGPGGVMYNLSVEGGKYGIYINSSEGWEAFGPPVIASTFRNQTEYAMYHKCLGTITFVGCKIEGGKGFKLEHISAVPWGSNFSIIDSTIEPNAGETAITSNRSVYLSNVYIRGAGNIVDLTHSNGAQGPRLAGSAGWTHVREYSAGVRINQSPNWDGNRTATGAQIPGVETVPNFIDGARSESPISDVDSSFGGAIPADLMSRHQWPVLSREDADVVNVKTAFGAKGDNVTDDTAALQAAIDSGSKVFLPAGSYRTSQPLMLRSDSVIFGVNKNSAMIRALPSGAFASSNISNPNPILRTPDDANATIILADFKLNHLLTATGSYFLHWRAGRNAVIREVAFDRQNSPTNGGAFRRPLVLVEGSGGGKIYNIWSGSYANSIEPFRYLTVRNTSEPLDIYNLNPEYARVAAQSEFKNARNFSIYAFKIEGNYPGVSFENCRNFRLVGQNGNHSPLEGSTSVTVIDCEDYVLASQSFQIRNPGSGETDFGGTTQNPDTFAHLIEKRAGQPNIATEGSEQYAAYKRGAPAFHVAASTVSVTNVSAAYGAPLVATVSATNAPYLFTATGLPAGIAIDANTGVISGSALEAGVFNVTVSAHNWSGVASATLVMTITGDVPTVTRQAVMRGTVTSAARLVSHASGVGRAEVNAFAASPIEPGSGPDTTGAMSVTPGLGNSTGAAAADVADIRTVDLRTVRKATATVTLSNLNQAYDGSPKSVVATTQPAGLPVVLTYNGSAALPIYPGSYVATARIDAPNYSGAVQAWLHISATVLVRRAPILKGDIFGSLQVASAQNVAINGGAMIDGDLLMTGQPSLDARHGALYARAINAPGENSPPYRGVTLQSGAVVRNIVRRANSLPLPVVTPPPAPKGTRTVVLNHGGQHPGDFATVRHITLKPNAGMITVPPGNYGVCTASAGSTLVLGVAGTTEPAVYNVQKLVLLSGSAIKLAGPVLLTAGSADPMSGVAVNALGDPAGLTLRIAAGNLILNDDTHIRGTVLAPHSLVVLNGASTVNGRLISDGLTLAEGALVDDPLLP